MKNRFLTTIIVLLDISFLISLFYITSYLMESFNILTVSNFTKVEFFHCVFIILILVILLYMEKIYTLRYDFWQESYKILKSFFIAYLFILAMLALIQTDFEYSKLFLIFCFFIGVILFPIFKRYSKKFLYKFDVFRSKVHIVGCEDEVRLLKQEFEQNWYLGILVVENEYESVFIISKSLTLEQVNIYISKYIQEHKELFIIPYITEINFAHSNILEYSNIRSNAVLVENRLLLKHNIWIKTCFEYILIILIFPFFLIAHVIIAILIYLDSKGAVFFKQKRLGKDAKPFHCYKYRTMYENSDTLLEEYLRQHPDEVAYYEEFHKYKNDPRITKIGKILRATSLDELAQIINVLKGEMSLVGPRPYMLNEVRKLGTHQNFILKVKPGITGLWQVSGRNNLTFKERNELEVWYIKNWSIWGDFVILIKTIKVVLLKVGAK